MIMISGNVKMDKNFKGISAMKHAEVFSNLYDCLAADDEGS